MQGEELVYWQIETTALNGQVLRLFGAALVVVFALLFRHFRPVAARGASEDLAMAASVSGVLAALIAFVFFVLLFNRLRRAFVLTDRGYVSAITDPRLFAGVVVSGMDQCRRGTAGTARRHA